MSDEPGNLALIEARLAVLTWMVGANVGLALLVMGSLFALWSKMGEVTGQLAQIARAIH